ncbi:MAG: glycosyltransferase family 2 protein [Candidatus Ryanbacteria bacterium]|nr:glycosyltransferase family 2 protein [Candidatus Ryanbacteria bacterium]
MRDLFKWELVKVLIVLAILAVLLGKIFFGLENAPIFLIIYGIGVTLALGVSFLIAFYYYQDPYVLAMKDSHGKSREKYFVSCMVAVRNEEENIARCIDSMLGQTYQKKEVIVVNDASTDGTLKILEEYKKKKKIKLISLPNNVGKKRALAKAMAVAQGNIFAHTDSDSTWSPCAVEKIVRIFEHDAEIGAVSGHGRALNRDQNFLTRIQDSWMEGQFSVRKAFESVFAAVTCVSGPLAVFRKEAVYNFIPAWENDAFLGQEFKFATDRTMTGFVLGGGTIGKKMKNKYAESPFVKGHDYPTKNWKVVYSKAAKSLTIVPDTLPKFIRQQVRWKKSFIKNIFFTGKFYWRRPVLPAFAYYAHIVFVLMGPFISFHHLIYLPLKGDAYAAILYLLGVIFVGFMFGLAYKIENKDSHGWIYRPAMSVMSTLVVSWLVFYSALTIRKMTWTRG